MAYEKRILIDYETVIDKELLDYMQNGIEDAHKNLDGITVTYKGDVTIGEVRYSHYVMSLPNGKKFEFSIANGQNGQQGIPGPIGPQGVPGNITIGGEELRFFVGTKADYDALDDKNNVFAIITDDPTQIGLIDTINGFLDGSIPIPNIEQNYVRKDENKIFVCSQFNNTVLPFITTNYTAVIGKLPEGKTLDEIAGVAALIDVKLNVQVGVSLSHSARLYLYAHKLHDVVAANGGVKFHLFTVTHDVTTTNSGGTTIFTNPVSMASIDVRLCDAGDRNISITFDNGAYTVIGDDRNGSAKLSDGVFKLINVRWWFA